MPRWPLARHPPARLQKCRRLLCGPAPSKPSVDAVLHDVAGSEDQHATRRDWHLLTGFRVATNPLALLADVERSERGEFDCLALCQSLREHPDDQLDQFLRLVARQANLLDDRLRKIRTRECLATHSSPPLPIWRFRNASCGHSEGQ